MDSSGNGERGQQWLAFFIDPFNIRPRERVGNFIKANQVAENRVGTVWWQNLKKSTKSSAIYRGSLPNETFASGKNSHQPKFALANIWLLPFFGKCLSLLRFAFCNFWTISFINVIFWAKITKKNLVMKYFGPKNVQAKYLWNVFKNGSKLQ